MIRYPDLQFPLQTRVSAKLGKTDALRVRLRRLQGRQSIWQFSATVLLGPLYLVQVLIQGQGKTLKAHS